MKLAKPKSQIQTILRDLIIKNQGVTESDYRWTMFRGYISTLRRRLNLKHIDKKFVNCFGRKSWYRTHFITNTEKKKAIKLYFKLSSHSGEDME